VNGFPHTAWLRLTAHFAAAFKTGAYPTIQPCDDRVYVWARTHARDAWAARDEAEEVGRPTNWELTEDVFWVVVLAASPASVELRSVADGERPRTHDVPAGISMLQHPLRPDGGIHVRLVREGQTVFDYHPPEFRFRAEAQRYNFNAWVGMYPPDS